jgi:hypothetical protein
LTEISHQNERVIIDQDSKSDLRKNKRSRITTQISAKNSKLSINEFLNEELTNIEKMERRDYD